MGNITIPVEMWEDLKVFMVLVDDVELPPKVQEQWWKVADHMQRKIDAKNRRREFVEGGGQFRK